MDEAELDELYNLIRQFVQSKQATNKPSLMSKRKRIQIDAPEDFAANVNLYMSGEKRAA